MLLTTSGSTGSPKLVRHKYGNLEANAENVAKVFSWTVDEVGICDLPMNYTMGLNVINSLLFVGASVLMIKANLMDPAFWEFIKVNGAQKCRLTLSVAQGAPLAPSREPCSPRCQRGHGRDLPRPSRPHE